MTSIIDGVDQRTRLVGRNRLELLLFRLGGRQRFGINVFKVREVIRCPRLTHIPHSHPVVRGVATMRGITITVIDLGLATGVSRTPQKVEDGYVIVSEFNRRIQGFLVSGVDRIINVNWQSMLPPPRGAGGRSYLTAVTRLDDELIEAIDVEKVLSEVTGIDDVVSAAIVEKGAEHRDEVYKVLVVDDSAVARKQIARTLGALNVEYEVARDGREALDRLRDLAEDGGPRLGDRLLMVISDVEMPEMDGYTLTRNIKNDPRMKGLHVLLHTSLSGVFNGAMVEKVGADRFLPKFSADDLGREVLRRIEAYRAERAAA